MYQESTLGKFCCHCHSVWQGTPIKLVNRNNEHKKKKPYQKPIRRKQRYNKRVLIACCLSFSHFILIMPIISVNLFIQTSECHIAPRGSVEKNIPPCAYDVSSSSFT